MSGENVWVLADFNFLKINLTSTTVNASGNTECAKSFESMEDGFLLQYVHLPMRSPSVLDLVLT